jgi:hypothetical protein
MQNHHGMIMFIKRNYREEPVTQDVSAARENFVGTD